MMLGIVFYFQEHATSCGSQLLLNVGPLKQLVTAGENSTWYVVADTDVLLNHMNLMNVLVNSGECTHFLSCLTS